ncbi:hypothetical protein MTO96_045831, partial [Rhipicephalus appendiculatus]
IWNGCEHCSQELCIVLQGWLPLPKKASKPDTSNSARRKRLYRKIWRALEHAGFWQQKTYKGRKVAAPGPEPLGPLALISPREVMPDCILARVRQLLPNEAGAPYMGHRWT